MQDCRVISLTRCIIARIIVCVKPYEHVVNKKYNKMRNASFYTELANCISHRCLL